MEVEAEQEVKWVFGGPQAPSVMDANIFVIKASPGASNPVLELDLIYIYIYLVMIFECALGDRR
jgi:hypothetical protein